MWRISKIEAKIMAEPKLGEQAVGRTGFLDVRVPELVLGCRSRNHDRCSEVVIDGVLCHLGNLSSLSNRIGKYLGSPDGCTILSLSTLVSKSLSAVGGSSDWLAQPRIGRAFVKTLGRFALPSLPESLAVYKVPGTTELVVFSPDRVVSQVKQTSDDSSRYHPSRVKAIRELKLRSEDLLEIVKWSFLIDSQVAVADQDIVVDEA